MPKALTGLAGELGFKRRDDPAAYRRAWVERNREKANAYNREHYHEKVKKDPVKLASKLESGSWTRRKAKYGITKEKYQDLLTEQCGRCKVCNVELMSELRVDHDHKTGAIRGLLCANCNSGLGMFQDDPDRLRKAAQYLESHSSER